jgi:hypothetical protein
VQRDEVEPVGQVLADAGQRVGDQFRHRQYGRAGVEAVPAELDAPGPPARLLAAFQHGDAAAGAGQAQRRRQPAQPRSDHDDRAGHGAAPLHCQGC